MTRYRTIVCCIAAGAILLVAGRAVAVFQKPAKAAATVDQPLQQAAELKGTDILPHCEGAIAAGRNYVYCGTFQLAWNDFWDHFVKGPIHLDGRPEMGEILNRRQFNSTDLARDCYLAMAGEVAQGIMAKIRDAMKRKFPQATLPVEDPPRKTDIVAFAYMAKNLQFAHKFDRLDQPLLFGGERGEPVVVFGVKSSGSAEIAALVRQQVTILDYENDNDFILQLSTKSARDELILAKIAPGKTLSATIDAVQKRLRTRGPQLRAGGQSRLKEDDEFAVPRIKLNVCRQYHELLHRGIEGWGDFTITVALQAIRFDLDETGVRLESKAIGGGGGAFLPKPRQLVFDKPFLLLLKQANSQRPYFSMWIENTEVLEAASR
jgi:hypothetical protein